jgi:hypothetical protein
MLRVDRKAKTEIADKRGNPKITACKGAFTTFRVLHELEDSYERSHSTVHNLAKGGTSDPQIGIVFLDIGDDCLPSDSFGVRDSPSGGPGWGVV